MNFEDIEHNKFVCVAVIFFHDYKITKYLLLFYFTVIFTTLLEFLSFFRNEDKMVCKIS